MREESRTALYEIPVYIYDKYHWQLEHSPHDRLTPPTMFAFLPAALVLAATACQVSASASYESTTPPDWIVYSYPTTDVVVNHQVTLGIDGAALAIPRVYYGLGYNLSVSTTFPNQTTTPWIYISNLDNGVNGWVQCTGTGMSQNDNSLLNSITFVADAVGR